MSAVAKWAPIEDAELVRRRRRIRFELMELQVPPDRMDGMVEEILAVEVEGELAVPTALPRRPFPPPLRPLDVSAWAIGPDRPVAFLSSPSSSLDLGRLLQRLAWSVAERGVTVLLNVHDPADRADLLHGAPPTLHITVGLSLSWLYEAFVATMNSEGHRLVVVEDLGRGATTEPALRHRLNTLRRLRARFPLPIWLGLRCDDIPEPLLSCIPTLLRAEAEGDGVRLTVAASPSTPAGAHCHLPL